MEEITDLQFSDDTILFSLTKREEFSMLKRILLCFEFVLKLKIKECSHGHWLFGGGDSVFGKEYKLQG